MSLFKKFFGKGNSKEEFLKKGIEFKNTSIEGLEITKDEKTFPVVFEFKENQYNESEKIKSIVPSCGCTSYDYDEKSITLNFRKNGYVKGDTVKKKATVYLHNGLKHNLSFEGIIK